MTDIEQRLLAAFGEARGSISSNPDLFVRVERSIEEDRNRRRWRVRVARSVAVFVAVLAVLTVSLGDFEQRRFTMSWWLIELLTNIVLVAIAVVLGPFIKRFGRAYAADVFRANPRTGKSYLVLTDVAYYLIFTAFILFTISFKDGHVGDRAAQWKLETARVGGILLTMGILHAVNVVALPVIGQMLSAKGLDGDGPPPRQPTSNSPSGPPLGPGTWILRVEPAGETAPLPPPS